MSPLASTELELDGDCSVELDEGPDPLLGKVLSGLYRVERRIGEGGMGTVYEATHVHLNKRFAVKVLSKKVDRAAETIERFRHEAMTASNIEHDNIVDVVNFDVTDEGDVFIVMELLRGVSLSDVIARGAIALDKAIPIAIQACRALAAAHASGIVHRDLKPENVFLVRKGDRDFVKILDFGISKIKSDDAANVRVTRTGQLIGTPLYMSPEQARGEGDVGFRADIYALGVMLYEMVTGAPPFVGDNYFQLLWKHGNEAPEPPSKRAPLGVVSDALDAAILRMLAKAPDDRFQSMEEVEAALLAAFPMSETPGHLLSWNPTPPRSTPPPGSITVNPSVRGSAARPAIVIGLAAVAAAVVGFGVWIARDGEQTAVEPRVAPSNNDPQVSEAPNDSEVPVVPPTSPVPTVPMQFDSTPDGAEVWVGSRRIGQTPIIAPIATATDPVTVRFVLSGYHESVISVLPSDGLQVHRHLRPLRPGSSRGGTPMELKKVY